MITDRELWACANYYIQEHGKNAAVMAAIRCDELFDACDYEGTWTYHAIIARINRLLEPPKGVLS